MLRSATDLRSPHVYAPCHLCRTDGLYKGRPSSSNPHFESHSQHVFPGFDWFVLVVTPF